MFRLLVTEDERLLCNGMRDTLETLGHFELFVAYSGLEALTILKERTIDAMLLDISMPDMNGLALMSALSHWEEKPVTIIVSGYDEFDFAREALNYGAVDYILKPIDSGDVLEIGERLHEILTARRRQREEMERARNFVLDNRDVIQQKLFLDIINQPAPSMNLQDIYDLYQIDLLGEYFCAAVLCLQRSYGKTGGADDRATLQKAEAVLVDVVRQKPGANLFTLENARYALLFSAPRPFEKGWIQAVLTELMERLHESCAMECHIGKGDEVKGIGGLAGSYHNANNLMDHRSVLGTGIVYDMGDYRWTSHSKVAGAVKKHIEENYGDHQLSVNKISGVVSYSANYIGAVFKRQYDISINDFINTVRIEHAKRLMGETGAKIYEIAYAVGFRDEHYFSKTFKKYEGISPKECRASQAETQ